MTMLNGKQNALLIRTPEGIVFSLLLAGPVTRLLAWTIDAACIGVLMSLSSVVLSVWSLVSAELWVAISIVTYFAISIGYGILTEWFWRGQTVGKRVLRLRVMDEQGLRLQPSQIVVRNMLRAVDMLPLFYLVGGVVCLASRRAQRLGDIAANTIVVRYPALEEPDLEQLLPDKFNSFRKFPHLAARLRQRASPEESSIALRALLRRNEMDPRDRVELFGEIVAHFREIVKLPEEATFGLTDEQYLRNVVDILFRA